MWKQPEDLTDVEVRQVLAETLVHLEKVEEVLAMCCAMALSAADELDRPDAETFEGTVAQMIRYIAHATAEADARKQAIEAFDAAKGRQN